MQTSEKYAIITFSERKIFCHCASYPSVEIESNKAEEIFNEDIRELLVEEMMSNSSSASEDSTSEAAKDELKYRKRGHMFH